MKEIGTFKIDKNMCSNCGKDEKCPQKYSVNGNCLYIEKDLVKEQVPETMEELGKMASDLAIEKKCKMRYMEGNDGSFFVCKDGEMYLFEETREMTIDRLYHKLIWVLGDTIWKRKE